MAVDITLYVVCALLVRINFTPMPAKCKDTPGPLYISEHSFAMRPLFHNGRLTDDAIRNIDTLVKSLTENRYSAAVDASSGLLVLTDKKPEHPITFFGLQADVVDKFYYELSTDQTTPIVFKGRNRPRMRL